MKTRWYKNAVIYQIYPRSFADSNGDGIGDIKGIVSKLDYLKELGVTAIWLSPCYTSPNDDNGYDISDYRNIMSDFGNIDDWELMKNEMHSRGIKLIMDLVVNHTSDEHPWFIQAKSSIDNPYHDYYIWKKGAGRSHNKPPNNWDSNFIGNAWSYNQATDEYYLHLFSTKQPDLNWDNPKVREEVVNICNFWLDKGVDGFRCDVIPFISKNSGLPKGKFRFFLRGQEHYVIGENWKKYISQLHEQSWSKYDTLIVGECALVPFDKIIDISDENNNLLDTSFSFDIVMSDLLTKFKLSKIKKIINREQTVPKSCWTSCFLENHDQPRSIPRFAPQGEFRAKSATMLATMTFMQRGTPYIYQGQEIGMTNSNFEDGDYKDIMSVNALKIAERSKLVKAIVRRVLIRKARDHARTPMQWSNLKNAGFTTGSPWMKINPNYTQINVQSDITAELSIYKYYQSLIKARAEVFDIISHGAYHDYNLKDNKVFQFSHTLGDSLLLVRLNFTCKKLSVACPVKNYSSCRLLISNNTDTPADKISNIIDSVDAQVYLIKL